MVLGHIIVKIIEIVCTPVAAVRGPTGLSRLHPGIVTVKSAWIFSALVFVNQQGRIWPGLGDLPHPVPVGAGILRKDENHRLAVVAQISRARRSGAGTDVLVVE